MILELLPRDLREPIAGDLTEEANRVRQRRGRAAAAVWFRWQVLRLAIRFRFEGWRRGRPLPPIDDEPRRGTTVVDGIRRDVAFGVRMLRRDAAFTAAALVALALGIGATTAIMTVADAVLWRSLPYPHAEAVVMISEQRPREMIVNGAVSPADFLDWRASARSITAMASVTDFALNLTGGVDPQRLRALAVSPGFFEALGVVPARGRVFAPEEELPGRHRVAIVTDGLWRSAFGRRPDIVGSTVWLNAEPYEVVGVLPPSFWWTSQPDIVVPRAFESGERTLRAVHMFLVIGRLAPGVSLEEARADMAAIGRRLASEHPVENRNHFPYVAPLHDVLVTGVRRPLLALTAAVGLLLLIACVNVSTLLLAQGTTRRKEIAIRLTLGAGRARVARQLLTEGVILAAIGGAGGIAIARWAMGVARYVLPAQVLALPGVDRIAVDARVLAIAVAATLATTIACAVTPACVITGGQIATALADGGRSGTAGTAARRTRRVLVAAEVAMALVLLSGASLLTISMHRLLQVRPGFDPGHVVTMRVTLPLATYSAHSGVVAFYESLAARLRATPGIDRAAVVTLPPFSGADQRGAFQIKGRIGDGAQPIRARPIGVGPDYFATMRIPLAEGRYLTAGDRDGAPEAAVINEAAARRYWPGESPIGGRISFEFDPPRWLEIVGVVGDVKHRGLADDPDPEVYLSYLQSTVVGSSRAMTAVVRTQLPVDEAAPLLRDAVRALDRQQPVGDIRTMNELVAASIAPQRLNLWLLAAFAAVALALTAAGVYGVVAYVVTQRTGELGIRAALGASPFDIVMLIARDIGVTVGAGIACGAAAALGASHAIAGVLFGVRANEPLVYLSVSAVLAAVAGVAAALPVRRAARTDPAAALRIRH